MKCNLCHQGFCDEELDFHIGEYYLDCKDTDYIQIGFEENTLSCWVIENAL